MLEEAHQPPDAIDFAHAAAEGFDAKPKVSFVLQVLDMLDLGLHRIFLVTDHEGFH